MKSIALFFEFNNKDTTGVRSSYFLQNRVFHIYAMKNLQLRENYVFPNHSDFMRIIT